MISDKELQEAARRYEKALLAGLPEPEASDWAYLVAEVINWEWIVQVLKAGGWRGSPHEAIALINSAVIVDEGLKVTVEAEKAE